MGVTAFSTSVQGDAENAQSDSDSEIEDDVLGKLGGMEGFRSKDHHDEDDDDDDDEDVDENDDDRDLSSTEDVSQGTATDAGLDDDFEDKAVQCFRLFVMFVLLTAMAVAGACTYEFLTRDQVEHFQSEVGGVGCRQHVSRVSGKDGDFSRHSRHSSQSLLLFLCLHIILIHGSKFHMAADTIVMESYEKVHIVLDEMHSFASSITAIGTGAQTVWPFFTTASFPVIGEHFRTASTAHLVALVPMVATAAIKDDWQVYSVAKQGWIRQGLAYDSQTTNSTMASEPMGGIPPEVYQRIRNRTNKTVPVSGPGPFGPLWQMSPAPSDPSPINFDMMSDLVFQRMINTVKANDAPVLSQEMSSTVSYFGTSGNTSGHPTSILVEPVWSNFEGIAESPTQMVASAVAEVGWESFFGLDFYEDVPFVYLVIDNGCSAPFTYTVDRTNITFLGYGDWHDPEFDSYLVTYPFAPFLTVDSGPTAGDANDKSSNNTEDLSAACQHYWLHVYPSSEFYDEYTDTDRAGAITGIVVSVFAAASMIFCCYDCAVHVRQRRLLTIAAQSEKILSVLYPKQIRDRLFTGLTMIGVGGSDGSHAHHRRPVAADASRPKMIGTKGRRTLQAPKVDIFPHHHGTKHRLKSFIIEDGGKHGEPVPGSSADAALASKPIADLFPHTTVLFADIAGFTAWSSVREPSQVFTLLETVYHAFDVMARRRGVFKVETVGDCYVSTAR
jgi:hypothetical protein